MRLTDALDLISSLITQDTIEFNKISIDETSVKILLGNTTSITPQLLKDLIALDTDSFAFEKICLSDKLGFVAHFELQEE